MRLFEVIEQGPLVSILRIYKAQADKSGDTLKIPFSVLQRRVNTPNNDGAPLTDPDQLTPYMDEFDKNNNLIDSVEEENGVYYVYINTKHKADNPNEPLTNKQTPSVKSMASSALPDKLKPSGR
jgi:hypothetical protein